MSEFYDEKYCKECSINIKHPRFEKYVCPECGYTVYPCSRCDFNEKHLCTWEGDRCDHFSEKSE